MVMGKFTESRNKLWKLLILTPNSSIKSSKANTTTAVTALATLADVAREANPAANPEETVETPGDTSP